MNEDNFDGLEMIFFTETPVESTTQNPTFKLVLADDDVEVHKVTKMVLNDFTFEGKQLEIIHAYSGEETIKTLTTHPDTAILFLDVVMEEKNSGFKVVEALRGKLNNHHTRIVLRTGQPGEAPEEKVIQEYDINDYRLKTEMTVNKMKTTLYSALRNYRDINRVEKNRLGLEKIIKTSANLFKHLTLNEFLVNVLHELGNYQQSDLTTGLETDQPPLPIDGFITSCQNNNIQVIAAIGKYEPYIGKKLSSIPELNHIHEQITQQTPIMDLVKKTDNGIIICSKGNADLHHCIYLEGQDDGFDYKLINIFLSNFSTLLNDHLLNNSHNGQLVKNIYTLAESIEKQYEFPSSHIKRTSEMMYQFSLCNNMSFSESELVRQASTLHDLGMLTLSDDLLTKSDKLTEDEFKLMRRHTDFAYKILKFSDSPLLQKAASIAQNHHEKYDGNGYPSKMKYHEIPLSARMMAIVDVFDAMTHNRNYREANSVEDVLQYLMFQKGKHFDPELVDLFVANLNTILQNT